MLGQSTHTLPHPRSTTFSKFCGISDVIERLRTSASLLFPELPRVSCPYLALGLILRTGLRSFFLDLSCCLLSFLSSVCHWSQSLKRIGVEYQGLGIKDHRTEEANRRFSRLATLTLPLPHLPIFWAFLYQHDDKDFYNSSNITNNQIRTST